MLTYHFTSVEEYFWIVSFQPANWILLSHSWAIQLVKIWIIDKSIYLLAKVHEFSLREYSAHVLPVESVASIKAPVPFKGESIFQMWSPEGSS